MTAPVIDPERDDYVSKGPYSMQARGISLQARGDVADGGGDINIMAHGSGALATDGAVNVRAARQILLDSGSARLACRSTASRWTSAPPRGWRCKACRCSSKRKPSCRPAAPSPRSGKECRMPNDQ